MSREPAIRKVVKALEQVLLTIPEIKVFIDRSSVEPVEPESRPALVLRVSEHRFSDAEFGEAKTRHEIDLDIDIFVDSPSFENITAEHAEIVARIVEAVHADRTLGGLLFGFEEQSASADEDNVPDLGCAVLSYAGSFDTPRGDFYTILGASGPIA